MYSKMSTFSMILNVANGGGANVIVQHQPSFTL